MKVFVIGRGGREHALVWKIAQSPRVTQIFAAPGNDGIAQLATCIAIEETAITQLVTFAQEQQIDLTIVGPESSLSAGVVDAFQTAGLKIFGPTQAAAQIEASKQYAKDLMAKYEIPTASYAVFTEYEAAWDYVQAQGAPIVVKADGLAAGKGVVVAETLEQAREALQSMLVDDSFGDAGTRVVIEECLVGEEFSFMAFVHGNAVYPMVLSQDHKRAYDGDLGPNTGGMGAYSDVPQISAHDQQQALEKIVQRMANALVSEGTPFTGFLYGGCMLTESGIKTIEFNARFGDPETEIILPRLESDLIIIIEDLLANKIPEINWSNQHSLGICLAGIGYPGQVTTMNQSIQGLAKIESLANIHVFHAGTKKSGDQWLVQGGRTAFLVATAATLVEAKMQLTQALTHLEGETVFWRTDIGDRAMKL
ncbi:MAG: phosphoribosylamine--glycine ligase [Culicoidibacterales bacterium]